MTEKPFRIKRCDLDAYAGVIESMRDACIARGRNFRGGMIELAQAWMSGKVAAAGSVSLPPPVPQTRRSPDVRQSIVKNTVDVTTPAPSALARTGAAAMLEPARSPAAKVVELLQLREQVDLDLGRLMAAMGIPMPAVNASPAPVATSPAPDPEEERPLPTPATTRAKRTYAPRAAKPTSAPAAAVAGVPKRNKPMVTDDFPGRLFSADQVRELCGVRKDFPLSSYVHNGTRVGGKHLFRYATAAEIAAAAPGAKISTPPPKPPPPRLAAREPEPDLEDDDDEEESPAATGGGRTTWECLGCFTQIKLSRPPGKCQRCGLKRFRVAPAQAAAV